MSPPVFTHSFFLLTYAKTIISPRFKCLECQPPFIFPPFLSTCRSHSLYVYNLFLYLSTLQEERDLSVSSKGLLLLIGIISDVFS